MKELEGHRKFPEVSPGRSGQRRRVRRCSAEKRDVRCRKVSEQATDFYNRVTSLLKKLQSELESRRAGEVRSEKVEDTPSSKREDGSKLGEETLDGGKKDVVSEESSEDKDDDLDEITF